MAEYTWEGLEEKEIQVDHPTHYGGADNTYEVIKVIDAWDLNFNLGNVVKYIGRMGKKDPSIKELNKALWYLKNEIAKRECQDNASKKD